MSVTAIRAHPIRGSVIAALVVCMGVAGVLAATANVQQRGSVLAQLERPARQVALPASLPAASIGPGPARVRIRQGPYVLSLVLTPNRAAIRNHVTIALTENGRGLSRARVNVSFSMPSMNMWQAFTSSLSQSGPGRYTSYEPVLGMAGVWRLRFQIVAV